MKEDLNDFGDFWLELESLHTKKVHVSSSIETFSLYYQITTSEFCNENLEEHKLLNSNKESSDKLEYEIKPTSIKQKSTDQLSKENEISIGSYTRFERKKKLNVIDKNVTDGFLILRKVKLCICAVVLLQEKESVLKVDLSNYLL